MIATRETPKRESITEIKQLNFLDCYLSGGRGNSTKRLNTKERYIMKHAKGPWSIEGIYGGSKILTVDANWPGGKRPIAKTINTGKESEFRANPKLIASAPELLEACKHALALIRLERYAEDCSSVTILKDAIDKAEA